jgi:hypothetical protein
LAIRSWILGRDVPQLGDVGMAVERAGVDRDLGVERHHLAALSHQKGVDLDEGGVVALEDLIELAQHRPDRSDHVGRNARLEGQPPAVELLEADQRIHVNHAHRLGVGLRYLLHVHASHAG